MDKHYRYRIIVPANTGAFNERMREAVAPVLAPDVELDVTNITAGSHCIECRADLFTNAPHVMELARETEQEGYDGIFVTDFDMCGVEPSRELVSIPIVGGFRPSAYTAMMLAQQFSIVTIADSTVALQRQHIRRFQIEGNFASIRPINVNVPDLDKLDIVIPKVFEQAQKAIEDDGAEAIILGCTGFIGVAAEVQNLLANIGIDAPVIDPNQAAICYLDLLVRNCKSQSRLTYSWAGGERACAESSAG